ncbi:hypothetical protein [Streptomyces sp. NPDC053431]|uniref:hypothetical protein n=1 Tax=Streptomyces sp. NPDC053431 TaxID=3365703 RepID=UPI0037D88C38
MQSFAVDSVAQQIYVLQCMPAGVRLDDEKTRTDEEVDGRHRAYQGDLMCTRLTVDGRILDRMYLRGFGHGTSFGVVPRAGGGVDLWLEGLGKPWKPFPGPGDPVVYAEGRAVATTAYVPWDPATNKGVDCADRSLVRTFAPAGTGVFQFPAVDAHRGRIVVGSRLGDPESGNPFSYSLYDLADFEGPGRTALHTITRSQPYPQGMATLGDHLYLWTGHDDRDDAVVATLHWPTEAPLQSSGIRRTPEDDVLREPEGVATWTPAGGGEEQTRLLLGFVESHYLADGKTVSPRTFTLKYLPGPAETDLSVEVLVDWTPIGLDTAGGVASGFTSAGADPRARLISVAGVRLLQLRGKITCHFTEAAKGGVIGTLPAALRPLRNLHAGCPRNARDGFAVCRVEANDDGTLYAYGATPDNTIDWIQLDNFSVPWV